MSKEAIVYFSGGKDSVMAVWKARQLGYDIKCAVNFKTGGTMDQDSALVEAVAAAIGIDDVRYEIMSYQAAQETLNKEGYVVDLDSSQARLASVFDGIKADYPNVKYVIFGIDDVQPTETIYMRKAHTNGMTAVNPFAMRYHLEFWNEVIDQELELRLQFPVESYLDATNYNGKRITGADAQRVIDSFNGYQVGDVLDASLMKSQYDNKQNFGLWSAAQTIVTNGKMFTAPVPVEVDAVSNKLVLASS
jgi:diphthamide synthase (EF-2-diphthine--ammonia ligase)